MAERRLRLDASADRSVTDVGPGDFVRDRRGRWLRIDSNTAHGAERTPRDWSIVAEGRRLGMFDIRRYAKAEDLE